MAVLSLQIPPSEFWNMPPRHFWWLVEGAQPQRAKPQLSDKDCKAIADMLAGNDTGGWW